MGILTDPDLDHSKIDSAKVNDIIATVSFIDNAMVHFIENCIRLEINAKKDIMRNINAKKGISDKRLGPSGDKEDFIYSSIVHSMFEYITYCEKLKICKKIAPSLFHGHVRALREMSEIRNRLAHEWFRGAAMNQQKKEALNKFFKELGFEDELRDINDEYNDFQERYNEHREFILTLERQSPVELLGLHEKQQS